MIGGGGDGKVYYDSNAAVGAVNNVGISATLPPTIVGSMISGPAHYYVEPNIMMGVIGGNNFVDQQAQLQQQWLAMQYGHMGAQGFYMPFNGAMMANYNTSFMPNFSQDNRAFVHNGLLPVQHINTSQSNLNESAFPFYGNNVASNPSNALIGCKRQIVDNGVYAGGNFADKQPPLKRTKTDHEDEQTNTDIYECNVCHYTSTRSSNFRIHLRTHTGVKPFACEVPGCGYASSQHSNLKIHQRIHFGIKPFKCFINGCAFASVQQSNLKAHLRRIHSISKGSEMAVNNSYKAAWEEVEANKQAGVDLEGQDIHILAPQETSDSIVECSTSDAERNEV